MHHDSSIAYRLPMPQLAAMALLALAGSPFVSASIAGTELQGWSIAATPNPAPYSNWLNDVHAIAHNDVWAVGSYSLGMTQALAIHYNGTAWTQVPLPTINDWHALLDVTATGPDDVWAVGWVYDNNVRNTLIMHYDGSAWSIVPSPNPHPVRNGLTAVTALSANDAWAVGFFGVWNNGGESLLAMHWDGSQWQIVPTPSIPNDLVETLDDVYALAPDDVWAVGESGLPDAYEFRVLHYDGASWQEVFGVPQSGALGRDLNGVVALAPDDVWVAGFAYFAGQNNKPVILHYNGVKWQEFVPFCQYVCTLWDIAAGAPDDILAIGEREVGGPDYPQAYRSNGPPGSWTYLNLEDIDGTGTGHIRGTTVLPSGEAWVVGWRSTSDGFTQTTRVYHYVPPKPPNTPGDINGDGIANVDDLLMLLAAWGDCPTKGGPESCPADLAPQIVGGPDGDGVVDVDDLLVLLANWG